MIGTRLGPYEITAKLGEGGMGVVYKAKDSQLGREVALKVLPAGLTDDPERLARFEREAQLLAQLNHTNIAQIHGLEIQGDTRALVMELVDGPTLADRLAAGALPLEESLAIARQIAEALEEAHDKGIIHRDLKPQNVKASYEGKVKVLDFGLAKAMDPVGASGIAPASSSQLAASPTLTLGATQMGMILGTAAYMAPEQAKGFAVDKRADIWAFGVVLFEMLTGARLFEAPTVPETLAHVLTRSIDLETLPPSTPPAIRRLLRRCLERQPRARLRDIGDARIVIEETLAGGGKADVPQAVTRRSPSIAPAIVATLAVAAALATGYLLGRRGADAPAARAAAGPPSFQKLTFRPGREADPALSPDGKALYFVVENEASANADIYFLPVGGRKPINLTADSPVDDTAPAISPDGRQIAFRSERGGGGVYLMGTTGESVRRLTDGCYDPAWSPDGGRIVCSTCEAGDPFNRGCSGTLRIVDVSSGASRDLETIDAAAPAWSPDGRRIAYWGLASDESGWRDLRTIAVEGGEPVELTHDAAVDWNPVWSEDGGSLYFLSNRGGAPNLWRIALDPASGRPRGEPASLVLPTEFAFGIHRAGGRWAYVSRSLRATIDRHELDPERLRLVGAGRTILDTTSRLLAISLSPDARRVAYSTVLPRQDLFVVDAAGGEPVQLTDDAANDRFPSWDPNGERILFMSNRGGRYEMWSIRADGSGLEQLTSTSDESRWAPSLSPDRRRLAVNSELGTSVFDASGPPPWRAFERLPNDPNRPGGHFETLAWSPDGQQLAGYERSAGQSRIAVWSFPRRTLQVFDVKGVATAWFPDGRRVLFRGLEGTSVLNVATGEVTPIAGEAVFNPSVSADLRTVVSYRNLEEADIWLAEGIE